MKTIQTLVGHTSPLVKALRKFGLVPPPPPPPSKDAYRYDPLVKYTHMIHTGENVTGISHLDLWVPQFLKAGVNFVVMTRSYKLFEAIKEKYPEVTVLFAKRAVDVSHYMKWMVALKACFYPSNTGNNLHPLMFKDIRHIFIGHGDSDKSASAHKFFRVYDENWVAGDAHIDRFVNEGFDFSGLMQVKVGRPSLEETLHISTNPWRERFDGKLKLLYLSTWEGFFQEQNYTSAYMMQDFFKQIHQKHTFDCIDIKLHPWVGRRDATLLELPEALKKMDVTVHNKDVPVEKLIKEANIFICDISAVISESLAANGPIFVYLPKDREIKLTQSKMTYADYAYIFSSVEELIAQIEDVIVKGNDYLADKREAAMAYILGKEETLQECFIKKLKEIA